MTVHARDASSGRDRGEGSARQGREDVTERPFRSVFQQIVSWLLQPITDLDPRVDVPPLEVPPFPGGGGGREGGSLLTPEDLQLLTRVLMGRSRGAPGPAIDSLPKWNYKKKREGEEEEVRGDRK